MNRIAEVAVPLFNSPVEIGLRSLALLVEAYPSSYSLQRLVVYDYLVVHSDDVPDGPAGIHPQTPFRGGELLVRRDIIQQGLLLYLGRGIIKKVYQESGLSFAATDSSGAFIDALKSSYVEKLRERAAWVVSHFKNYSDQELDSFVREHLGQWGAEFEMESVFWEEQTT